MTATLNSNARHRLLAEQLTSLRTEQAEALSYLKPQPGGDDADRATNVEANVRLAMITDRISSIEQELSAGARSKSAANADVAEVGDIVTVDFGDGPEDFLLASVEQQSAELDVITPASPLGRALLGATAGNDVEYQAQRRTIRVRLVSVAGLRPLIDLPPLDLPPLHLPPRDRPT